MPSISSLLRESQVGESLGPSEYGCSINQGPQLVTLQALHLEPLWAIICAVDLGPT